MNGSLPSIQLLDQLQQAHSRPWDLQFSSICQSGQQLSIVKPARFEKPPRVASLVGDLLTRDLDNTCSKLEWTNRFRSRESRTSRQASQSWKFSSIFIFVEDILRCTPIGQLLNLKADRLDLVEEMCMFDATSTWLLIQNFISGCSNRAGGLSQVPIIWEKTLIHRYRGRLSRYYQRCQHDG